MRAANPVMCWAPPSYDSRPRSFRPGQRVHQLGQLQRVLARGNPASRADRDVDDDVGDHAGLPGRGREVARVALVVHRLDEPGDRLRSCMARRILAGDEVARGHADAVDALRQSAPRPRRAWRSRCRSPQPRAAAWRCRRCCASWRAAASRGRIACIAACIVAMFASSRSRSTHSAGVSRSHFDTPTPDALSAVADDLGRGVALDREAPRRGPQGRSTSRGRRDARPKECRHAHTLNPVARAIRTRPWTGPGRPCDRVHAMKTAPAVFAVLVAMWRRARPGAVSLAAARRAV